jgi:replicative DNA helicase
MKARTNIEEGIIASCLFTEANALLASDILSAANFQETVPQRIFSIIRDMAGKSPIDLITVSTEYFRRYNEYQYHYMAKISDKLIYTNIQHHCLILLEIDIREKFVEILKTKEHYFAKAQSFEMAAAVKSCLDYIQNPSNDIFTAIQHVYEYLKQYLKENMEDVEALYESLPKLMDRVRSKSRIKNLIDQLNGIAAVQPTYEKQRMVQVLTDALITVISQNEVPLAYKQIIHQLMTDKIYE